MCHRAKARTPMLGGRDADISPRSTGRRPDDMQIIALLPLNLKTAAAQLGGGNDQF